MVTKEVGDLRKIALSLEEMAEINSEEISPKVGDLKRIADALENLDVNGGDGTTYIGQIEVGVDGSSNMSIHLPGATTPIMTNIMDAFLGESVDLSDAYGGTT